MELTISNILIMSGILGIAVVCIVAMFSHLPDERKDNHDIT